MATYIKQNGSWVAVNKVYRRDSDSWIRMAKSYRRIDGSWVKVFEEAGAEIPDFRWDPDNSYSSYTITDYFLVTKTAENSVWRSAVTTQPKSSGKWYAEVVCTGAGGYNLVGIASTSFNEATYVGGTADSYGYNGFNGYKFFNTSSSAYGNTYTQNDIISIALNLDTGKIWWGKNDSWQASGDPENGTNEAYSGISGTFVVGISCYPINNAFTLVEPDSLNFSPPTGFTAWQ